MKPILLEHNQWCKSFRSMAIGTKLETSCFELIFLYRRMPFAFFNVYQLLKKDWIYYGGNFVLRGPVDLCWSSFFKMSTISSGLMGEKRKHFGLDSPCSHESFSRVSDILPYLSCNACKISVKIIGKLCRIWFYRISYFEGNFWDRFGRFRWHKVIISLP